MGQRLNIEIKKGDKVLANSYYHWSAYSQSSCEMAIDIANFIKENQQNCEDVLYAIRILEHTGAGLTDNVLTEDEITFAKNFYTEEGFNKWYERHKHSELKTAQSLFPNTEFKECNGRNNGLLAITEIGMEETRTWEEGRMTINLDNNSVDFAVVWTYDKEFEQFLEEEGRTKEIIVSDFDFSNIPFERLEEFLQLVINAQENDLVIYSKPNKKEYVMIY